MHRSVLADEVLHWLAPRPGGVYVDGTVGGGGHARAIADAVGEKGRVLALDRDANALKRAGEALGERLARCVLVQANFADVAEVVANQGLECIDGLLLDVGISSDQLDAPERGFSFMQDGPLDMRMDQSRAGTAADLLNALAEAELAGLLRRYGEEPRAGAIARRIVQERQRERFERTGQLAGLVMRVYGGRRGRLHPATRTFQALRIAVNGELAALEKGVESGLRLLAPGGRMVVISFHSLEDRLVKQSFAEHRGRWASLPAGGSQWVGRTPAVEVLTRKPVMASEAECEANPRARSAKLRAAERKG